MSEIAIMTDSNCGIMPGSEPRPNIHIIPMPVLIDGEIFFEGTSITTDTFYQKLSGGSKVSTSPSLSGGCDQYVDSPPEIL